jgi:hypothetical protein
LSQDAEPDQILGGKVREDLGVDVVLAERRFVLSQPQTTQPGPDVHGLLLALVFSARCSSLSQDGVRWERVKRHELTAEEGQLLAHLGHMQAAQLGLLMRAKRK